jgi:probable rRNA maturation factor
VHDVPAVDGRRTPAADSHRSIYLPPWRVDVVTRAGVRTPLPAAVIARAVVAALTAARAPEPGSVTVVLTDDAELEDLNVAHMGHEGPTDVLSFPMLEPDAFRRTGPNDATRPRPRVSSRPGPRTHIGDIAISVERASEQAVEGRGGQTGDVRWSTADELRLLVTHGTLHLCGWDHAEPAEEAAMRTLEQALLQRERPAPRSERT